jgi:flagellar protein FliO/FliZ
MAWYVLKLLVLLPLIGALVWGSLKFSAKLQQRMLGKGSKGRVRIVETLMLSPTLKLAVLEFHGRVILVSAGRGGLTRLAEAPASARVYDGEHDWSDADDWADDKWTGDEDANSFARKLRRAGA